MTQAYVRESIRDRLGVAMRTTLSRDEELDLARRYRLGDKEAGKKIIEGNLPVLFLLAKRYRVRKEHIDDLIGEGVLGLYEALEKFDPGRGLRFSTYSSYYARAYMRQYVKKDVENGVKAPISNRYMRVFSGLAKKKNAVEIAVAKDTGKSPEHSRDIVTKRLAEMCSMTVEELRKYEQLISSKDEQLDGVGCRWTGEKPFLAQSHDASADELLEEKCKQHFFTLMHTAMQERLDPREQKVLHDLYFVDEPLALAEIGRGFGVSRERARQLKMRSFKKLYKTLKNMLRNFDLEEEFLNEA